MEPLFGKAYELAFRRNRNLAALRPNQEVAALGEIALALILIVGAIWLTGAILIEAADRVNFRRAATPSDMRVRQFSHHGADKK
jgi:hypothetical protein